MPNAIESWMSLPAEEMAARTKVMAARAELKSATHRFESACRQMAEALCPWKRGDAVEYIKPLSHIKGHPEVKLAGTVRSVIVPPYIDIIELEREASCPWRLVVGDITLDGDPVHDTHIAGETDEVHPVQIVQGKG